jgi:fatty-acid desaturase
LQILSFMLVMIGLFVIEFSWLYLLVSILCFYCYSVLGISMTLHRYYSHKSFKMTGVTKWLLTILAILAGRGSPLGWVYIHRMHHATSDTEKDPHSPRGTNFKFFGFKPAYDQSKKINYFIVKDLLTPLQIKIDKYYMLIIVVFLLMLGLINYNLIVYIWALPVLMVSISQTAFNYFAHMHGYRNFETRDRSTNNVYLWPFILGDAWHNNHHAHAEKLSTKVKPYELDPLASIITWFNLDK